MRFQLMKFLGIVAVSLPGIVSLAIWLQSGPYAPEPFSDWDEFYYIPHARDSTWSKISLPHEVIDLIVLSTSKTLGLSLHTFSFVLDIFCAILAFLLTFKLFTVISANKYSKYAALAAATCCVLQPWLWSEIQFFVDSFVPLSPRIDPISHHKFPSLPTERAFYTQLSWLLYPILLILLVKILKKRNLSWLSAIGIGILSGVAIYSYFFLWATIGALLAVTFLVESCIYRSCWGKIDLIKVAASGIVSALISLPGLSMLSHGGELFKSGPDIPLLESISGLSFSDVWFVSPFGIFLIILVFYTLLLKKRQGSNRGSAELLLILVLSSLIAELFLMNSQPLLGKWLTPYHFTLWYLHPLLTGIIIFMVLDGRKIAVTGCLILMMLGPKLGWAYWQSRVRYGADTPELLAYIDKNVPKDGLIFAIPYILDSSGIDNTLRYSVLPFWISTLTNKTPYVSPSNYERDRSKYVERELDLSYVLTGRSELLGYCPITPLSINGNDMLSGAGTYMLMQRTLECHISQKLREGARLLPSEGRTIFVVIEKDQLPLASAINKGETWRSTGGRYFIYSIPR